MEEAEHSRYVAQLKAEFDSCDTTSTGFLDRDELTELCRKLQLDEHLPLLLNTLLGERTFGRVNFEEFKDVFVAVLSRSLDFSTSEDDSSYLEPALPEEVKPKFVKGTKRYGRRSRPDSKLTCDSEDSPPSRTEPADLSPPGVRRAKLRRSTSLESVESLKSDEETGIQKNVPPFFQSKGDQQKEELEVGGGHHDLTAACDHLGLHAEDVDVLLRRLDADLDGRVSISEFKRILCSSASFSSSTPLRSADVQRAPLRSQAVLEELSARSASPSLLTATVGQRVLSRLDDGSGCTSPERVAALWTEEGIRNSRDILQTLDFPLEERLSLADLTLALDNELLVSGNGIHQAALISYKNEIQHLQEVAEQACRERDKLKADLDVADQRNLQLVREVDDRHASMETLNESRIRDLEQDFRDRLMTLRCQSEQESEVLLQQMERERQALLEELQLLRGQEAELQEELCSKAQENQRLEEELSVLKLKLTEAESSVNRLQEDLNQLLHDKGSLDAVGVGLSHEERISQFIREYELHCRELRDRNDELSSELELLKSNRKSLQAAGAAEALSWSQQLRESDSDESDMKQSSSPTRRKRLQPDNKTGLCSLDDVSGPSSDLCLLDDVSGPAVSIQTEMAVEQLKQKHQQELQQLNIQLETQVNYYERSLEKMRQSMEVERKDISQAFKLEISELEEQKSQLEQKVKELKEALDKLQNHIQLGGGCGDEQERRMQRDRVELETNFAREISNLVQNLSAEKDQLEAELKLKMDQEVMSVREESDLRLAQVKLQHQEQVRGLQEAVLKSGLMDLDASQRRCSELEARLEEACAQLEDSIAFLESQELLNKRLVSEKSRVEEQLLQAKTREEQVLVQVSQLKAELKDLRDGSDGLLQDRDAAADNCSRLSCAFIQQQVQLRAKEQTIASLQCELENLQETLRSRTESFTKLATELDSLKMDRDRLIQDLKDQAMAVDNLQLELDSVSEELDRRRSSETGLQEALRREQNQTSLLRSSLAEEEEEVRCLSQENRTYMRLVDQLSTQIVEMEEEISSLRDHLRDLSSQLNGTADLVLDLRKQLNSKTSNTDRLRAEASEKQARSASEQLEVQNRELDRVKEQVCYLQQALQDSQNQLRSTEEDFDREKRKMAQQLMELERLVLDLEDVMDPTSPHRTQLEEVRSENGALREKLSVLQQEVQSLEEDVTKKRRRLEDMERGHERSREEEERLHQENSKYREEVLNLSSRNLQLSSDNSELSARLHGEQESVRMLRERLATVSREQEEGEVAVRRLQDAVTEQEREKLQLQTGWKQEKQLLERELSSTKEKLGRQSQLEAELSSLTLKLQWIEEDKERLQREVDDRNNKVEKLQQQLVSVETEAELLRSQLHAFSQKKVGHAQEVTELQRKLQEAHSKVEELEIKTRRLMKEKEEQEEQASVTLREETQRLQAQNQELQNQLSELQVQDLQVHKLTQEQENLKTRLNEVQAAHMQAQDQVLRADAALSVVQAQHLRQLHELQEQAGGRKEAEVLQERLDEETRRREELEEALQLQAQQNRSQISTMREQYEKAAAALEQRVEDMEVQLKGVRLALQEKVQQLKEQMAKSNKASAALKDLFVENSQLMKALQVTEQRQKQAEKKNFLLEDKVGALNKLLREIVAAALAT